MRFSTRRATCAAVTTGSGTTLHTASGGISYKSYLSALRKDVSDVPDMPPQASEALKALIGSLLHNAPEWKRKRYVHRRRLPEALAGQERPRNRTAALEPFRR